MKSLILDYTRHTLDGAACLLNSNKYFPSRVSIKVTNHQDCEVVILFMNVPTAILMISMLLLVLLDTVGDCHLKLRRAVLPSLVPFVAESTASSPMHTFTTGDFLLCILSYHLAGSFLAMLVACRI